MPVILIKGIFSLYITSTSIYFFRSLNINKKLLQSQVFLLRLVLKSASLFLPLKLNLKIPTYCTARIVRIYLKLFSVIRKPELYSGSTVCLTGEVFLICKHHLSIDWSSWSQLCCGIWHLHHFFRRRQLLQSRRQLLQSRTQLLQSKTQMLQRHPRSYYCLFWQLIGSELKYLGKSCSRKLWKCTVAVTNGGFKCTWLCRVIILVYIKLV